MPRTSMATLLATIETLSAQVATLTAAQAPVAPSVASAHWKSRDLPCTWKTPCTKTFRTVVGQEFHASQPKHAAK